MTDSFIIYKTKSATQKEVYTHLEECKNNFYPILDVRVNIKEYSGKIITKSVTFEAWKNKNLIGLIAAYFNDPAGITGYISNVSVKKEFLGEGIAKELMNLCISYAKERSFKEIKLEVHSKNNPAINLYNKFGFNNFYINGEFLTMKLDLSI